MTNRNTLPDVANELKIAIDQYVRALSNDPGVLSDVVPRQDRLRALCRQFEDVSLAENRWGSPFVEVDEDDDETVDELCSNSFADGDVLTLFERWDLRPLDAQALLEAGQQATGRLWPTESERAVRGRIDSPPAAITELLHESPPAPLAGVRGIEELPHSSVIVIDGNEETEDAILRLVRSCLG